MASENRRLVAVSVRTVHFLNVIPFDFIAALKSFIALGPIP